MIAEGDHPPGGDGLPAVLQGWKASRGGRRVRGSSVTSRSDSLRQPRAAFTSRCCLVAVAVVVAVGPSISHFTQSHVKFIPKKKFWKFVFKKKIPFFLHLWLIFSSIFFFNIFLFLFLQNLTWSDFFFFLMVKWNSSIIKKYKLLLLLLLLNYSMWWLEN